MNDKELRESFGQISELYDFSRSDYPKKLIKYILKKSEIPKQGKILEVGCGTGKATILFIDKGYDITALDLSQNLINKAKEKIKPNKINFMVNSFEKAPLPQNRFDLLISASSFHWVEPKTGFEKAFKILKNGGIIALFWNIVKYKATPLMKKLRKLNEKYFPGFKSGYKAEKTIEALEKSDLFCQVKKKQFSQKVKFSKDKFIDFAQTYSELVVMNKDKKKRYIEELSKILPKNGLVIQYKVKLIMARKPKL